LFLSALALRLLALGASLLWYDEAFTVQIVQLPFLRMLETIRGDVHPPLWYAIEFVMNRLGGNGPFIMRLPSAVFGALAVVELHQLVKRISGETPARWAGVMMAAMPGQLYYSQEARMYSLFTLLVLLGARAVIERNWLRLALCCSLLMYTQNLAWIYVAILAGWGLLAGKLRAFKFLAAGGISYIPWAITAVKQAIMIDNGFWLSFRPNPGSALYFLSFTTVFTRLPQELYIHGIALSLALTAVALFAARTQFKKLLPLLVLGFAPPLALYAISFVWRPILLDRGLLPAGAAVIGLWGAGLSTLTGWGRKALAAFALPLALAAVVTYYTDPTQQRPRTDPIRETIIAEWQPGDVLYHVTLESFIAYSYYLPDKPAQVMPEAGDLAQSLTDISKTAMGVKEREMLFSQLHKAGYKRAWLFVVTNPVTSDYEVMQAEWILSTYPTIKEWIFLDEEISQFKLSIMDLPA
jgi:predicted membrane-bound mannosyltransferase